MKTSFGMIGIVLDSMDIFARGGGLYERGLFPKWTRMSEVLGPRSFGNENFSGDVRQRWQPNGLRITAPQYVVPSCLGLIRDLELRASNIGRLMLKLEFRIRDLGPRTSDLGHAFKIVHFQQGDVL